MPQESTSWIVLYLTARVPESFCLRLIEAASADAGNLGRDDL